MKRASMIALVGAVALVGCENMGLDYAGPEEEASHAPPRELVAEVTQPAADWGGQQLVMDGQLWTPWDIGEISEDQLRPVGSAGGQTVYARSWDDAPYDALFTRMEEEAGTTRRLGSIGETRWLQYATVIGGGGHNRPRSEGGATGH